MRRAAALVLGLLLSAAAAAEPVVKVVSSKRVVLTPGRPAEWLLGVVVAEGFHLQANPPSEDYLIPTRLELAEGFGLKPGRPAYPSGRPYRLPGASTDLSVYDGRFEIRVPLDASPTALLGEHTLVGKLHYQACDARRCLSPSFVVVELLVTITRP